MMSTKPAVLVTRSDIPAEVLNLLHESCDVDIWTGLGPMPRDELLGRIAGKDGVLCLLTDKMDEVALDAAGPSLKVISSFSVGLDHVDIKTARLRGMKIGHTPGVLTDAVSELAIGLMLATARRFFEAREEIVNGGWGESAWSPLWMCGKELRNSVIGIVGMGRIGHGLQKRLQAFRVAQVLYTSRATKPHAEELGGKRVPLDELLSESDFVVCCLALTPETKEILNKNAFEKMKRSAIFINVSRGGLVNQDDLIEALKNGTIAAAGLDVMTPEPLPSDHELLRLKNCTVIPHIGSATSETRLAMGMLAAHNLISGLNGASMPAEYRD